MRILIVDDEPLARSRLVRLLAQFPEHQCVAQAETAVQALEYIQQLQPELVLLDIAMPGQSGIELGCQILQLPVPPAVIFVTAHPQHALAAYEASPSDYLLKPVSQERLALALQKVGALTRAHLDKSSDKAVQISYQLGQQQRQTKLSAVYYFTADQKYTRMVFTEGSALLDLSLTQLEQQYPQQLLRIHRNCLINKAWFRSLQTMADGTHYILLDNVADKLEVSRRALARVKQQLSLC
ncbi:response regulator transcription factor [Rheinheimera sp. D18]|uniref:LytR/AlgR family response regulator transcription factor n=1 Tax=Rheinheimera sp. D18 TaxID=2545632 RepID=UPI001053B475|nr:LytTR family DNA-binding domain-containing protein [Rheinheimera sp. D18]QBL10204.1 response regulator transcription factor [Rheinheimera sp. D18]